MLGLILFLLSIVGVPIGIWGINKYGWQYRGDTSHHDPGKSSVYGTVCAVCGVIFFCLFVGNLIFYFNYVNNLADLLYLEKKIEISQQRLSAVIEQLKAECLKYNKHEAEVYKNLTPEKVSTFAAMYPQLASIKSVEALIQQIVGQNQEYFNLKYSIQDKKAFIYAGKMNAFCFIPVELKE
jgi:hypothetical protein